MRLHELPLACARLTCGSDLDTWASILSFVISARRLNSLTICQCDETYDDDYYSDEMLMLPRIPMTGADGTGAEECARDAEICLRMRGGAMETIAWRNARDSWRL
jgi:hypothetical protein